METDAPVVPSEQWIAPFSTDGSPAGSVTAWREDGVVTFASADDHAELGAALVDLPTEALVVHEPLLGAHFALVGGTVTTLVPGFYEGAASVPLGTFRAALAKQVDGLLGGTGVAEPGVQWWVPVSWGVLAAAVVAGLAVVTLVARRRAASGHT